MSTTIDPFWDISLDLGNVLNNGNGKSNTFIASTASVPSPTLSGNELNKIILQIRKNIERVKECLGRRYIDITVVYN